MPGFLKKRAESSSFNFTYHCISLRFFFFFFKGGCHVLQNSCVACNQSHTQSPVCVTEVVVRKLMSGACWQEGGVSLSKNKQAVKSCSEVGGEQTLHRPEASPRHCLSPRTTKCVRLRPRVFWVQVLHVSSYLCSCVVKCVCVCVTWGEGWDEVRSGGFPPHLRPLSLTLAVALLLCESVFAARVLTGRRPFQFDFQSPRTIRCSHLVCVWSQFIWSQQVPSHFCLFGGKIVWFLLKTAITSITTTTKAVWMRVIKVGLYFWSMNLF